MKTIIILLILFLPINVTAEDNLNLSDKKYLMSLADEFAKCQGVYKAFAIFIKKAGYQESAENTKGYMRGAHAAGIFLVTLAKKIDNPTVNLKYSKFSPYIDSLAHGVFTQTKSFIEQRDMEQANKSLQICIELNKTQVLVIKMLRQDMYDLP